MQDDFNDRNQWVTRADYELQHESPVRGHLQLHQGDRRPHRHRHGRRSRRRWCSPRRTATVTSGPGAGRPRRACRTKLRIGGNLAPVDFKSDVDFSSGVILNVPGIASTGLAAGDVPAAGAQHAHVSVQRHAPTSCWATTRCSSAAACSRSGSTPTTSRVGSRASTFGFSSAAPAGSRSRRRSCPASPLPT